MELYVGMDLSLEETSIRVADGGGEIGEPGKRVTESLTANPRVRERLRLVPDSITAPER